MYPDIHSEVMCSCDWRIGTLYLYPNPLQCLIQLGLEDRYIPLVPRSTPMSRPAGIGGSVHFSCTQIHSNVFCSRGWRIGTFICTCLFTVHCHILLWLEDRYILLVPRSTPRSYTNLISLFRSRPIAWLCDIPDFT